MRRNVCRVSKRKLSAAVRKERREHPWTTLAQARKIARDHLCGKSFRGFGGMRRLDPSTLTIPYYRALIKVANAGIGHPGTVRKVTRLVRWGLIRKVRNTSGYEITAKGVSMLNKMEEGR